jgi:GrpB-like predicted nucleotidyltransferase (UPF0157 family)
MNTASIDLKELHKRLEEAIAWYLSKAPITNPKRDLRSDTLAPSGSLAQFESDEWRKMSYPSQDEARRAYHHAQLQVRQRRQAIVDEVASKRRAALQHLPPVDPAQIARLIDEGRLLIYYPDENLCDGAAPAASADFFDVDNIPPWDTWLLYVSEPGSRGENYLIAWVPPELLKLAAAGVDVNPEECIMWADDLPEAFVEHLQRIGLLRKTWAPSLTYPIIRSYGTQPTHHSYDPRAPEVARRVARLITSLLPDTLVEHIGSTAVPGCAGKGIVDLLIPYRDAAHLHAITGALKKLGFQHQTTRDPFPEDRPMRVGSIPYDKTNFLLHVHVVPANSSEIAQLRAFRDRLRAAPALRDAYVACKRMPFAKSAFIQKVLKAAPPPSSAL